MLSESARSGTGSRAMDPASHDAQLRQAAFDHVNRLAALRGGVLDSADLAGGFEFDGQRIPLINPQRGIFKPRQMEHLLSIKTVFPRRGARVWYDDQREAHRQIYAGDDVVDYQFMGTDANSPDNRWLLDAMQRQVPIIYFLGTSPGRYQPIIPTFIVGWHAERLRVDLAFGVIVGASAQATSQPLQSAATPCERSKRGCTKHRFAMPSGAPTEVAVRSAICPNAAHIIMDADEQLGQPVISNGLPLTKLHHAAFDAHLIGIDPDYRNSRVRSSARNP
jgi:putative restriction endonuclease